MKIIKYICIILIILIILMTFDCIFNSVYATENVINMYSGNVDNDENDAGGGIGEVRKIIGRIISIVQVFGIFIAVAMCMSLGIKYMYSSPGDRAQIKNHLTIYVIGAVVMFGSAGILQIIKTFFVEVTK